MSSPSDNIVLIGFMASGKSTVGRILAKKSGRFFIDSDNLIESFENRRIEDIFKAEGEEYFRENEQRCLEWMLSSLSNSVISTGGGMPIHCTDIRKLGKIVFLKTDFQTIKERLEQDNGSKRPLAKEAGSAKKIYDERTSLYDSLADVAVDASGSAQDVAEEILKKINRL